MASDHDSPDPVEMVRLAVARYRHEGHRVNDIRDRWGLSETHFWQLVNAAVDDPWVQAEAPIGCRVLQERRERQRRMRRAG